MKINFSDENESYSQGNYDSLDFENLNYPDFLMKPMFNMDLCIEKRYFDEVHDPYVLKAMKIRRKYSDIFKYFDALDIYDEYIEHLLEKYPSMKSIRKGIKEGYIEDFLPPMPVLKKSKTNMTLLKTGIRPSRRVYEVDDSTQLRSILSKPIELTTNDLEMKRSLMSKKEKKAVRVGTGKLNERDRINSLYTKTAFNPGYDVIKDFFTDEYVIANGGKIEERSFLETVSRMYEASIMTEADEAALDQEKYYVSSGKARNAKDQNLIELYKFMAAEGYDVRNHINNSGMDRKAIKLISSKAGIVEPMTKRELKKFKKKNKKLMQAQQRRLQSDNKLRSLLQNSRDEFGKKLQDESFLDFTFDEFMGGNK